mmetsp:Transcript_11720/g.21867  ORF Transcript_11720/g.21867 Transcript_11720/m.21867 type:complete len:138 (-) Transcript_11720:388-801(-)
MVTASTASSVATQVADRRQAWQLCCQLRALPETAGKALALHCCLALALSGVFIIFLSGIGLLMSLGDEEECPAVPGYSWCGAWKDCRALLAVIIGCTSCTVFFQALNNDGESQPSQGTPQSDRSHCFHNLRMSIGLT